MKNKLLAAMIVAAVIMGGCSSQSNAPADKNNVFEKIDQDGNTDSAETADEGAAEQTAEADASEESASTEDYTEQIKTEVDEIASKSEDLTSELASVKELYDKYDELRMNAETQTEINALSGWGTLVWKDEVASLLERIKEANPSSYNDLISEHEKWEKNVPAMAERMSYLFVDGSIYPSIYACNEAMRYKECSYSLASTLADLNGEVAFSLPEFSPCGYYGDYEGDSYLVITEGMESDSYNVMIHFDDTKELQGWGFINYAEDGSEYIDFTSDDDTVEGMIPYSRLEASLYVTKTDGAVIGPEGAWTFSFKY
jgi:hypothetical protein